MPRREGQLLAEDFFNNVGGLNTAQSPFIIPIEQTSGGMNYDYISQGAFRKRAGHTTLNTVANTQHRSLGLSVWNPSNSDIREVIRAAERKVQTFDLGTLVFSDLTQDNTTAGSDFFATSTIIPVVFSQFNTSNANMLWMSGGGLDNLAGVVSPTKVTYNGVAVPTASSFTATPSGSGSTLSAGTYRYTLTYRKASTKAESNAFLEATATPTAGQNVVLAWTLTNDDTVLYDKINVYRSAIGGASQFTTGDLIAQLSSTATGYTDTGSAIEESTLVPRIGNITDNSVLPITQGIPIGVTLWKRHLVTAINSTIYFSDTNKSESWPLINNITIPSGGKITGFGVLSFTSRGSNSVDELLVIYKQNEIWLVTGTDATDFELKFIDNVGCPSQSLVAVANGFIYWVSNRGFHIWNGTGKPGYLSRYIEDKFQENGVIDKSKLALGVATYSQKRSEIDWILSTTDVGENKSVFKLNLKLTLDSIDESVGLSVVNGIFTPDTVNMSLYAAASFYIAPDSPDETYILGDGNGFLLSAYSGLTEAGGTFGMQYDTPFLSLGPPGDAHQYHKVVAWVLDTGSWDLELDYWTQFRYADADSNSIVKNITQNPGVAASLWDVSLWDVGFWDSFSGRIVPVVFNLSAGNKNNVQGDSIKLSFRQSDTGNLGSSVIIYGFSIYYTDLPLRK